jgi:hypothetical protein
VLCFVDTESQAPRGKKEDPFSRGHHSFTKRCEQYRDELIYNYKAFCDANMDGNTKREEVDSILFKPLCYQTIDRACNLDIVLVDDFDAVHHLTAGTETSIEDVYLAFCPVLESLNIENPWWVFCEFGDLFGEKPQELQKQANGNYEPPSYEFQKTHPLLAFTRYKMDGLGAIGQSLLFQQSLFRAMAAKINDVIDLLRNNPNADKSVTDLIDKDAEFVKCVFLDLQGAEEIGTLVFCNNYSVAMSLNAALRSLTFGDLFDTSSGKKLEELLNESKAHSLVFQLGRDHKHQEQPENNIHPLRDNHAIRWSHTSLAITSEKLLKKEYSNCKGYIEALGQFILSPGHRLVVEREIRSIFKPDKIELGLNNKEGYCRYQIGIGDMIIPYGPINQKENVLPLLKVESFLTVFKRALNKFKFSRKSFYRDVVHITVYPTVPVPRIVLGEPRCKNMGVKHFHPLTKVLYQIRDRLCHFSAKKDELDLAKTDPRQGLLDIQKLKGIPYGIPVSLQRMVEYLYQNFAILIGDPYTFDLVLDLYDAFSTLHAILTRHIVEESNRGQKLHYLDEGRVAQLSAIVDAIHNALLHRIAKARKETNYREMEIDFRGGLNQILLAADSPIKCGLGLIRRLFYEDKERDRVGGSTLISSLPGARINNLNFGIGAEAQLVYFEADVPHVLHPASYCDNLHEIFHLIFDILWSQRKFQREKDFKEVLPVIKKRVSEVFANLLTHIFVFGPDKANFLRHHLCSYSKSIQSVGRDDCGTMIGFGELIVRLFLVADAVPNNSPYPEQWDIKWKREGVPIGDVFEDFKKTIKNYGPFFSDYYRLWTGANKEIMQDYCWRQFNSIYPQMAKFMPYIWSEAIKIYKNFMEKAFEKGDSSNESHYSIIEGYMEGLSEGKPMIWGLYGIDWDPLFLICRVLHNYLKKLSGVKDKELHLCRAFPDRKISYKKGKWFEFQIDRGAAAMFCPVPSGRRDRLKKQIAILKTFWDISSNVRKRRLLSIIQDNWPELSQKRNTSDVTVGV